MKIKVKELVKYLSEYEDQDFEIEFGEDYKITNTLLKIDLQFRVDEYF